MQHHVEAVPKIMYMAKMGLPCTVSAPLSTRAVTTPLTMAANLALNNAGQLAGLVLSQLVREGTPQVPCRTGGGGMDMRTMVALHASPDLQGYRGGLAHFYDLPTFGWAGSCDSKLPDEQASGEASLTLLVDALEGSNLIHDVGFLESGKTNSLEMLVMCDEIIGWIKRFMQPQEVNDETLALDLIHETGPDGNFLVADHTIRHLREEWAPNLMDRGIYEKWKARGGKSFRERAREQVEKILQTHRPPDLGNDVKRGIRAVLERAAECQGVAVESIPG
jgi:trimethylamine--corrinoid protein Co-methyltransferase